MHKKNLKKGISIKPFLFAALSIAVITVIYATTPSWLPDVTIKLAKEYVDERKGIIGYKLSLGIVFTLSGYIGFLLTEKKKYKELEMSSNLKKGIVTLQTFGGVFVGWGIGLLANLLLTHNNEQITIAVVTLAYLILLTFCPLLFAEEVISWKEHKKKIKATKYSNSMQRILCLVIMIFGAGIIVGVLFAGW
jgi:nitrate reductase gamma subunit